jgi:hypothetical protein
MTGNVPGMVAPTVNPLVQFLQAAGQFPQEQQQSQEEQLKMQQEKQELQQQKFLAEQQQQQWGQSQLSTVAKMVRYQSLTNPSVVTDPATIANLVAKAKAAGLDPATFMNPDGSINLDAIPGSGGIHDLDPNKVGQLTPAQKNAWYPELPESIRNAPQVPTPAEIDQRNKSFQEAVKSWSSQNWTTDRFVQFVKDNYQNFVSAGIDVDSELQHIQNDPSYRVQVGAAVDAKVQEYKALGLDHTADATYKNMETRFKPLDIQSEIARRASQNATDQQNANSHSLDASAALKKADAAMVSAQAAARNAKTNMGNMQARLGELQTKQDANTIAAARLALSSAKDNVDSLVKQYDIVSKQYDTAYGTDDPESVLGSLDDPNSILSRMRSLHDQVTAAQKVQTDLNNAINSATNNKAKNVTGNPLASLKTTTQTYTPGQTLPGPNGTKVTFKQYGPNGQMIVTDQNGKSYYYTP